MSTATDTRHYTIVTLAMRKRMREMRVAGLGSRAIALMIALDFDLPAPPSRDCVDAHAPVELFEGGIGAGAGNGHGRWRAA